MNVLTKIFCGTILFSMSGFVGAGMLFNAPVYAATQEIAAVVNEDVISIQDLNKRLKMVIISSGLPNKEDIREKLTPQVLSGLVDEQIMLQEAARMNIVVEQQDIDDGFAQIAAQNNFKPQKFKATLRSSGIDISTMERQIRAQVSWGKVVQARLRSRVVVSERDVDDTLDRMRSKVGSTEYLAAEIFLPVDNPKQENKAKQLANRLIREIKAGKASFFKLAQQFSASAGSVKGGDTGWMNETQIDEAVLKGLKKIKKDQITTAIRTAQGYHIMFLRDARVLNEENLPSRDQIHYNLGAQRLEKLQYRYLMDLKASAFVDFRV